MFGSLSIEFLLGERWELITRFCDIKFHFHHFASQSWRIFYITNKNWVRKFSGIFDRVARALDGSAWAPSASWVAVAWGLVGVISSAFVRSLSKLLGNEFFKSFLRKTSRLFLLIFFHIADKNWVRKVSGVFDRVARALDGSAWAPSASWVAVAWGLVGVISSAFVRSFSKLLS